MIAPDDYRGPQLPARDEIIQAQPEGRPLPVAEPANARGQPLKVYFLSRHLDPPAEAFIPGEHFEHQVVGHRYIRRVSGKRHPSEGSAPLAKKRPDIGGDKSGEIERVRNARFERLPADIVSIIECDGAARLQF